MLVSAAANCGRQPVVFTAQIQASPEPIRAEAVGRIERNAGGRLRMSTIEVTLHLGRKAAEMDHLQRVLDTFEEFCTVSQSIKTGWTCRWRCMMPMG